jgi:hypothetical protein
VSHWFWPCRNFTDDGKKLHLRFGRKRFLAK